jgi:hypothetical protein
VPVLVRLYGNRLPEEIATLNKLCEKCRSRAASERIKDRANRQKDGGERMNGELENQLNQLPGAGPVQNHPDGLWMDAAELNVLALAELMKTIEARLTTISAISIENGETEIIYHFAIGGQAINVKTRTKANAIPSITKV